MAFLAILLLLVVTSAAPAAARAHGAAHGAPQTRAKVALDATGFAANCMPEDFDGPAAAHAACCSMAGCAAPVASLAASHLPPDDARHEAAFPVTADSVPVGIGASPVTPPPRRPA